MSHARDHGSRERQDIGDIKTSIALVSAARPPTLSHSQERIVRPSPIVRLNPKAMKTVG